MGPSSVGPEASIFGDVFHVSRSIYESWDKRNFSSLQKKTNKQTNSKLEIVKEDVPLQILNKAQNPIQPRSQGLFSSFGKREEPGNDQSQQDDHRMYSKGTTG